MTNMESGRPKNPFYDGAATTDNIWPGVPLIIYNMKTGWVTFDICKSTPFVRSEVSGSRYWIYTENYLTDGGFRRDRSLADFGLEPYRSGDWNGEWITVLDTPEDRAQFIAWLSQKDTTAARQAIRRINERVFPVEASPATFLRRAN